VKAHSVQSKNNFIFTFWKIGYLNTLNINIFSYNSSAFKLSATIISISTPTIINTSSCDKLYIFYFIIFGFKFSYRRSSCFLYFNCPCCIISRDIEFVKPAKTICVLIYIRKNKSCPQLPPICSSMVCETEFPNYFLLTPGTIAHLSFPNNPAPCILRPMLQIWAFVDHRHMPVPKFRHSLFRKPILWHRFCRRQKHMPIVIFSLFKHLMANSLSPFPTFFHPFINNLGIYFCIFFIHISLSRYKTLTILLYSLYSSFYQ